jgi:hypothetical protein
MSRARHEPNPTPIVGSTGTRRRSSPSSRNARRALLRAAIRAEVGRVEGLVVGPRQPDPTDGAVIVEWAIERSRRNVDLSHASSDAHRSAIIGRGPVGHRNPIRVSTGDSVPSPAVLYALFYAIIRRVLRLNVISSDAETEVLVLRHELAVLRWQIKRPKLRRRDKLFCRRRDRSPPTLSSLLRRR